jgi:hypothetical protein
VELRGGGRSARDHERSELRQLGVDLVAARLEPARLLRRHAQASPVAAVWHGDVGADVEQVVLHVLEPRRVAGRHARARQRDAELRVELVDGPVRLDPRMRLRHAAHVAEVRLALVAVARVDAREVHHRRPQCRRAADAIRRGAR